jgi:DNA repair exonuclease SbcCD nuclease subunit
VIFNLFTDPHLGTRRSANTTRESSKKLQQALYEAALAAAPYETPAENICLGDLFDRAFNDESTLVQGHEVANRCAWTLSGNHDETNREGTVTTLAALKQMGHSIISAPDLSTPYFEAHGALYFVPHHASQELFEKAMMEAAEHAAGNRDGQAAILLLHCNYNCAFEIQDDTLNLPEELAAQLLDHFDLILLGHEHKPATHLEGRVVILGNTHPTSFSDLSDKYRYLLDDETAELTPVKIWSMEDSYRQLKYGEEIPDLRGVQFVDVVGAGAAEDAVAVAHYVQQVWAAGDDLLAVRNNVQIGDHLQDLEQVVAHQVSDLRTHIDADLEGSDLQPLYRELLREVMS